MRLRSRFSAALGCMLGIFAATWLPATMALAAAQSPATVAAMYYSNELIIIGSFFTLILGVFATMRYVPPIDVPRPITGATKVAVATGSGISAFLWVLDKQGQLTILHPVYVLGVTFVSPVALQLVFPIIIEKLTNIFSWLNKGENK